MMNHNRYIHQPFRGLLLRGPTPTFFGIIIVGPCAIDRSPRERWFHPTFTSKDHHNFNVLAVRI